MRSSPLFHFLFFLNLERLSFCLLSIHSFLKACLLWNGLFLFWSHYWFQLWVENLIIHLTFIYMCSCFIWRFRTEFWEWWNNIFITALSVPTSHNECSNQQMLNALARSLQMKSVNNANSTLGCFVENTYKGGIGNTSIEVKE